MTKLRPRKPSASMIVALIALFVAMGGSSYAAVTLGKNSVGSKQLKKNAVTSSKIKKNAVTGSKIKNGAVTGSKITNGTITGSKINLSSLGTVPSATTAGSVTGLKRYTGTVTSPGASQLSPNSVTLATFGPFTVLGECYTDGTNDYAYTAVESSQPNEWLEAGYSTYSSGPPAANTPIQVSDSKADNQSSGDQFYGPNDGSWAAETSTGTLALNGQSNQGVQLQGTSGPACSFSGSVVSEGSAS